MLNDQKVVSGNFVDILTTTGKRANVFIVDTFRNPQWYDNVMLMNRSFLNWILVLFIWLVSAYILSSIYKISIRNTGKLTIRT
jgi:hypothetical protein